MIEFALLESNGGTDVWAVFNSDGREEWPVFSSDGEKYGLCSLMWSVASLK